MVPILVYFRNNDWLSESYTNNLYRFYLVKEFTAATSKLIALKLLTKYASKHFLENLEEIQENKNTITIKTSLKEYLWQRIQIQKLKEIKPYYLMHKGNLKYLAGISNKKVTLKSYSAAFPRLKIRSISHLSGTLMLRVKSQLATSIEKAYQIGNNLSYLLKADFENFNPYELLTNQHLTVREIAKQLIKVN